MFVFQGTLPPPYSSAAPSEANGSLSSPVSTMTSQSSASSLTKQRQSWLDLVSHASPAAGETAVVCSAQVHLHHSARAETAEGARLATQDSTETGSNEEAASAGGEEQKAVIETQDEGECLLGFILVDRFSSRALLSAVTVISISYQQNI